MKYSASGWWTTIAAVDWSGIICPDSVNVIPDFEGSKRVHTNLC